MRKGKKALLIAAAMILTIVTLAVLNFVRSKMQTDEASGKRRLYLSQLAPFAPLRFSPRFSGPLRE